ncbi:MAG: SUMF1/EgtB/PvdO family nonheme iron enzyme [Candidatus Sumerlaeia bacterium]|nr:SUMF1/EgtB/PvdO family nonheme iron enzyme [Candidatus Sumerlaeia bacterium]
MKKITLQPSAPGRRSLGAGVFILCALSTALIAAPIVSNVEFEQRPSGSGTTEISVTYDLVSDDAPSTVSLLYSLDAAPYEFATAVTGDVGGGIDTGTDKEILWSVPDDLPGIESDNFVVRVLAEDGLPIELSISATVAENSLTNDPNQTVTFAFNEAVIGFTSDDVTVTNASKGAFAGSGAVYTLDVTAIGDGTVSIQVPTAAATSASGTGNTTLAAGPYSFEVNATPPTLTNVTISSDNPNPERARVGETITLSLTASENITVPNVTIAGNSVSVTGSDDSYTAIYVVQVPDEDGVIPFTIEGFEDIAGNVGTTVTSTTDDSLVIIDNTEPAIASIDPPDGSFINSPTEFFITFTEEVTNLSPGQFTVNGSPADSVTGSNPYAFSGFAPPALGSVTVTFVEGSTSDLAGNALPEGGTWSYENELIEFVSVPAGTFTMGASDVGDDATLAAADELINHEVTLSAYEIGKYPVTSAEFATVMNWALAQGLLASNTNGDPYTGQSNVYLMAPDATSTRRLLFRVHVPPSTLGQAQIEWTGTGFGTRVRGSNNIDFANHPVNHVSWYGAVAFCNFLAEMEGKPVAYDLSTWEHIDVDPLEEGVQFVASHRLATESEWERAAGWSLDYTTRYVYCVTSDTITFLQANYNWFDPLGIASFQPRTSPVGWYNGVNISPSWSEGVPAYDSPSPVGAYDMAGNVWEWVFDWAGDYTVEAKTNPIGPALGTNRRFRGGTYRATVEALRVSNRGGYPPGGQTTVDIGFRIATVR